MILSQSLLDLTPESIYTNNKVSFTYTLDNKENSNCKLVEATATYGDTVEAEAEVLNCCIARTIDRTMSSCGKL